MSDTATGLEAETRYETITFTHFGREWNVPTKRHLAHILRMRDEVRQGVNDYNVLAAEVMLGEKQFLELCDIDPDEDQLAEFAGLISKTMGLDKSGN